MYSTVAPRPMIPSFAALKPTSMNADFTSSLALNTSFLTFGFADAFFFAPGTTGRPNAPVLTGAALPDLVLPVALAAGLAGTALTIFFLEPRTVFFVFVSMILVPRNGSGNILHSCFTVLLRKSTGLSYSTRTWNY